MKIIDSNWNCLDILEPKSLTRLLVIYKDREYQAVLQDIRNGGKYFCLVIDSNYIYAPYNKIKYWKYKIP